MRLPGAMDPPVRVVGVRIYASKVTDDDVSRAYAKEGHDPEDPNLRVNVTVSPGLTPPRMRVSRPRVHGTHAASVANATLRLIGTDRVIKQMAFDSNKSLFTFTFESCDPTVLGVIEDAAFYKCPELRYAYIQRISDIGNNAFQGCKKLTSVDFTDGKRIGINAFRDCWALETVASHMLEEIGNHAFMSCKRLRRVDSMDLVKSIGKSAFFGCTMLQTATIPAVGFVAPETFAGCTALESVDISSAYRVGEQAFLGCKRLVRVTGSSITHIEPSAFMGCKNLSEIDLTLAREIEEQAFSGCEALTNVDIRAVVFLGPNAFARCTSLERVKFDNGRFIEAGAFKRCRNLTSVTGLAITTIETSAFSQCHKLEHFDSLAELEVIEEYALHETSALKRLDLSDADMLHTIETGAFAYSAVAEVRLPWYDGPKKPRVPLEIQDNAFSMCKNLDSLELTAKVGKLGSRFAPATRSLELDRRAWQTFDKDAFDFTCSDRLLVVYGEDLPPENVDHLLKRPSLRLSLVTVTLRGPTVWVECDGSDPLPTNPGIAPLVEHIAQVVHLLSVYKRAEVPRELFRVIDQFDAVTTIEHIEFLCKSTKDNGWLAKAVGKRVKDMYNIKRLVPSELERAASAASNSRDKSASKRTRLAASFVDLAVVPPPKKSGD